MKVLITGAAGFLGRHLASLFAARGHEVHGIGRGRLSLSEQRAVGLADWREGRVTADLLADLPVRPEVVIHCAGSGSVSRSLSDPLADFEDTVHGTAVVLEYLRLRHPEARLIYPSSPAVNGVCPNQPIAVSAPTLPVSPYGHHKLAAEVLCESYRRNFAIDIRIVRLFSVYGAGLRKQLLWDACCKLRDAPTATFWGDGLETRDFVHVDDVAELFHAIAVGPRSGMPSKMNCGSGHARTVAEILGLLDQQFDPPRAIGFNGQMRAGDPRYYWADNTEAMAYAWTPQQPLETGLAAYAAWFKALT